MRRRRLLSGEARFRDRRPGVEDRHQSGHGGDTREDVSDRHATTRDQLRRSDARKRPIDQANHRFTRPEHRDDLPALPGSRLDHACAHEDRG